MRIQANPTALSSYGIDLENLRTALTQNSVNAAKGNFDGPKQDYQIDANDQLVTAKDYEGVIVAFATALRSISPTWRRSSTASRTTARLHGGTRRLLSS